MGGLTGKPSGTDIQNWLTVRIAHYLQRSIMDIDPLVPLAETGIDSVSALNLCGDVEDAWGVEVDPTLVYDYPTISDIAGFLVGELAARAERTA